MLSSEEAARRLGVKLPTIYAYVSRGLLASYRAPDGRRSLFDVDDVEALARRSRPGERIESRLATVTTAVTEIRPGEGPSYRGIPATRLAIGETLEAVSDLLWESEPGPWVPAAVGVVPVSGFDDRLRWAVVMSGAVDALRSDVRPVAVARAGRTIIATMVAAFPAAGPKSDEATTSIPERLASRLASRPSPVLTDAVRAALVLVADHELASSTVAVRIAASTRSDVYDAVLSGLGTMNGPLHGGASRQAHLLLLDAQRRGSAVALDDALRWQRAAPGFGQFLYEAGDPRWVALLPFVERLAPPDRLEVLRSLVDLAAARGLPKPNVDLALAGLTFVSGMEPEAGGVLFKVARVAGWIAHYLEELTERPLRYRARAIYVTSR